MRGKPCGRSDSAEICLRRTPAGVSCVDEHAIDPRDAALVLVAVPPYPGDLADELADADALASFQRTLISVNSSYDRYLRGERSAISEVQIEMGEPTQDAEAPQLIRAAVEGAVPPGTYTVDWRTMARDGHVIRGDFRFTYESADRLDTSR